MTRQEIVDMGLATSCYSYGNQFEHQVATPLLLVSILTFQSIVITNESKAYFTIPVHPRVRKF